MLRKLFPFIFTTVVAILLFIPYASAQDHDFSNMEKEYPLLMERYGNRLESRNAHYIFAIDISSSMTQYEQVVRESLKTFIQAIPDKDQVTIIVVCDENNTNYLNSIKCISIEPAVRQSIIAAINSQQFKFLKKNDPHDGSDMYGMTSRVLEAMNVVNSSDLTFVYLLTDFEYWTHRNKFNKGNEDWLSLKPLLTEKHRGAMCKYGVELAQRGVSHPEAVIKPELDAIFGPIDYQPASDAAILKQWFGHIVDEIRAQKINSMLKADWKQWLADRQLGIAIADRQVEMTLQNPDTNLISGFTAEAIYTVEQEPTWYPSYIHIDSADVCITANYESKYAEEIHKLQGLCKVNPNDEDAVNLTRRETIAVPYVGVWNSTLPKWAWALIILLIAMIIISLIWEALQKPQKRLTSIQVKKQGSNGANTFNGDTDYLPYTIGEGGDLSIPGAAWRLKIEPRRYNPIFNIFRKTGYYGTLESGDFADIINETTDYKIATLQVGKTAFLFRYKHAPMVRLEITEGITTYIITIS